MIVLIPSPVLDPVLTQDEFPIIFLDYGGGTQSWQSNFEGLSARLGEYHAISVNESEKNSKVTAVLQLYEYFSGAVLCFLNCHKSKSFCSFVDGYGIIKLFILALSSEVLWYNILVKARTTVGSD